MEKDKVLDAEDKAETDKFKMKKAKFKISIKNLNGFLYFVFLILVFEFFSGCSIPRIVILDDPLTPEEHINLGVAYEKNGELDDALKEYKLASKSLPLAYLYIGNVYYQKKDFDEAESAYQKAIDKDPLNADAHNNLAWLYYTKKEKLDEAEALALKAIELNPAKKDLYQDTLDKIRSAKGK